MTLIIIPPEAISLMCVSSYYLQGVYFYDESE